MASKGAASRQKLAAILEEKREDAGRPSHTDIAHAINCSQSTVSRTFSMDRGTRWVTVESILRFLGADPAPYLGLFMGRDDSILVAQYFDETEDTYRALTAAVRSARSSLRLTYIRQSPPDSLRTQSAIEYFDAVLKWAKETEKPVQRVIGVPTLRSGAPHSDFLGWLERHQAKVQELELTNYDPCVFEWFESVDLRNHAIVDEELVFELWAGNNNQLLRGVRVEGAKYAESHIESFDQLFASSRRLRGYLDGLSNR